MTRHDIPDLRSVADDHHDVELVRHYSTSRGVQRAVLLATNALEENGAWSVYDIPVDQDTAGDEQDYWLVKHLADAHGKQQSQAADALAASYHAQQLAYHRGESAEDPLPRPRTAPLEAIRTGAEDASDALRDSPLVRHYKTWDGVERVVLVGVDAIEATGVWSVYDLPADQAGAAEQDCWLVERLDAFDEKLAAAAAVARSYQLRQKAYQRGVIAGDPLPRPQTAAIDVIAANAQAARQQASGARHQGRLAA